MSTMNLDRLAGQVHALISSVDQLNAENQSLQQQLLTRAKQCEVWESKNDVTLARVKTILLQLKGGGEYGK